MRVLVVEDDPDLAEYACAVLRRHGNVAVEVAFNGRMALESFHTRGADILITDIELPGMTGIELATSIRQVDPDMPVAMMTAHASVDYAVSALRNQIDEFLVKPVSAAEFRSTLVRLMELRTARNAAAVRSVVLAIGAHPDDVEIGVGGLLAVHRAAGDSVVILTLCRGDRGGSARAPTTRVVGCRRVDRSAAVPGGPGGHEDQSDRPDGEHHREDRRRGRTVCCLYSFPARPASGSSRCPPRGIGRDPPRPYPGLFPKPFRDG